MNCAEFKAVCGSYALGAIGAEKQREALAHLNEAQHDGCLQALAAAEDDIVHLAKALAPTRPRPEIWLEIDRLVDKRTLPPERRRPSPWPWLVAALSLAVATRQWLATRALDAELVSVQDAIANKLGSEDRARLQCLHVVASNQRASELQRRALGALTDRATVLVPFSAADEPSTGTLLAVWDKSQMRAYIVAHGLPPQSGRDYAVWLTRGATATAAGLIDTTTPESSILEVEAHLLESPFDAFTVTLEPQGGGDAPSGPVVYRGIPRRAPGPTL